MRCGGPTFEFPGEAAAGERSASTASVFKRHLPHQPLRSASILPPYALRAGRHVCDSLWPDRQSTKSQEPLLQGTASPCSTWPLFLQASAGKNPARSLPGSQDTAVPAVGADSVSHRSRASRPSPLLPLHAASHRLRRWPRISDVEIVLLFDCQCQFAKTVVPRPKGVYTYTKGQCGLRRTASLSVEYP